MEQILTLKQLVAAAENKRAVFCPTEISWSTPRAAAFVINLPGITLHRMLTQGLFLVAKTSGKPKT